MIRRLLYLAGLIFFLGCCSNITVENPSDKFLAGKRLVKLDNKKLEEISGGAASVNNSKYFWLHNDSGNNADVFLVDDKLNILLTCTLDKIENRDWEDVAVGPGPETGKNYIYIAEIGDNLSKYSYKHIYRFEEPTWDGKSSKITITKFDTITFELDERKDAETVLLHPPTKDLYIVSKREEPVWVYRLKYPQSTTDTVTAEKLISLPLTQIVGGDFSADGERLVMKNYEHIYFWDNELNKPVSELLQQKPFEIHYEIEPQGEAIMWARDDSGFYTLSEKNKGKDSYLYFYQMKK